MDSPPVRGPDTSGPRIIRPIPRRPFNLNLSSPTPPEDEEELRSPPKITANDLRFLAAHQHAATPLSGSRDGSTPLSHTTSYLNLTSPTLFGIYSPSTLGSFSKDEDDQDRGQYFPDPDRDGAGDVLRAGGTDTPIDKPVPRPGLDEETYTLMRQRSNPSYPSHARRSSTFNHHPTPSQTRKRKRELALQLVLRATLLFILGVGYGVLVTRIPQSSSTTASHHTDDSDSNGNHPAAYETHYEWRYLAFWGAAGVALGTLLPWFDRFWEDTFSSSPSPSPSPSPSKQRNPNPKTEILTPNADNNTQPTGSTGAAQTEADWPLVVRGIGAFVGIVFAIRKLPWASTMQVSLTLALANPFLWYLIDRSKPGFLLSAAVGLAGSAVLMGLDLGFVFVPVPGSGAGSGSGSGSGSEGGNGVGRGVVGLGGMLGEVFGGNATGFAAQGSCGGGSGSCAALGGLASQETIETSIWMLSVLFCSCVCFGNIGRRLALNSSAAGRGRWGGVR